MYLHQHPHQKVVRPSLLSQRYSPKLTAAQQNKTDPVNQVTLRTVCVNTKHKGHPDI